MKKAFIYTLIAALIGIGLTACSGNNNSGQALSNAVFNGLERSDMSGYASLDGYENELVFYEMTVKDVLRFMDEGKTFAVIFSFAECPWCNVVIPNVNDAALDYGFKVGHVDTRKDPSWKNNLDMDDYDLFAERFSDCLETDDNGKPHLYTPHIFFIKDGSVVYDRQGALSAMGNDPSTVLTEAQEKELTDKYRGGFNLLLQ